MHKVVDILLWNNDPIAKSVKNCLQKKTDMLLFDQNCTYNGFLPDIVVITAKDIIKALQNRLDAKEAYPTAKIVYVRHTIDAAVIGITMLVGFDGLISTKVTATELYKMLCVLGETPKFELSARKRSRLIIDQFNEHKDQEFTFRQYAILCGLVRNLSHKEIAKLLNTTTGDVYIAECLICQHLGISKSQLTSPDMVRKYGAVEMEPKYKVYTFPSRVKRPGYYLIPKFFDE